MKRMDLFEKIKTKSALSLLLLLLIIATASATISSITVVTPNGGENWSGKKNITWTATCSTPADDYFDIQWTSGSGWNTIVSGLKCSTYCTEGSCSWEWNTTSVSDGTNYQIKVKDMQNPGTNDISDNVFTIDNTGPGKVSDLGSSTHTIEEWSTDNDISFEWTDAEDDDLDGYYVLCDNTADTDPTEEDTFVDEGVRIYICEDVEDSNRIYFHIRAVDDAGNLGETEHSGPYYVDATPPEIEIDDLANYYGPNSWPGTITGTANDNLNGIKQVQVAICYEDETTMCWNGTDNWQEPEEGDDYIWNEANYDDGNWNYNIDAEAFTGLDGVEFTVKVKATDNAGNEAEGESASFTWDETPPESAVNEFEEYYGPNTWPGTITGTADDTLSGTDFLMLTLCYTEGESNYCWDGETWSTGAPAFLYPEYDEEEKTWSVNVNKTLFTGLNGKQITANIWAIDNVENEADGESASFTWDETAPTVLIDPTEHSWTGESILVLVEGTDEEGGSGMRAVYYAIVDKESKCPAIGGEGYTQVVGSYAEISIEDDGEWKVCAYAEDIAGNVPEGPDSEGIYQFDAGAPVLEEEGSMYSHSDKTLALLFDDELTEIVDETKIQVSYDPEATGFAIDAGDACFIGGDENNFVVCSLSIVHRDLIQGWYLSGYRTLYIFVEASAVEDKAGNQNENTTTIIAGEYWTPQLQGEVVLKQGWNFISVPLQLANDNTEEVLELEEGDAVYYYYNGSWRQPETLEPMKGYLVYKESTGKREITYDYACGIQEVPPSVTVVGNKWNMIGPPKGGGESGEISLSDFLNSSLYNYVSNRIFTYNNTLGSYVLVSDTVNTGVGYWVFFRSTAVIPGTPCYTEELD
ncbi:MAG: hypothetical protein QXK06_03945 [Candidatus Diapherotrites archaeon]